MRIPKRLSMVSGHDNQRVVGEARSAYELEQPREMTIGFMQHVQVALEVVIVAERVAAEGEHRHVRRRLVRMVRLRGPRHDEEWTRSLAFDRRHDAFERTTIFN